MDGLLGELLGVIEVGARPFWTIIDPAPPWLRWDFIAAGVTVVGAIALTAWLARTVDDLDPPRPLRVDHLLYIVLGMLPGAVIGGRLLHGLAYLDVYAADPGGLFDAGRGTLSLLGVVAGGTISGITVARLLASPWRRWLDLAAPVLLLAIAGAKFTQFLGGGGQGLPWDGPWAVAFLGPGPWKSVFPAVPAHPAQLYEAFWVLAGILPLSWLDSAGAIRRLPLRLRQHEGWLRARQAAGEEVAPGRFRFGLPYLFALGWWLAGRFAIGFTWRDDVVVGPLRAEQAMALAGLVAVALLVTIATRMPSDPTVLEG